MMRQFHRGVAALAAGVVLLAGCATSHHTPAAAAVTPAQEQHQVEAHAHYAQGMIFDMDNQPDKANEEFSAAALADPANEELVLELTRRYARAGQSDKALPFLEKAAAVPGASAAVFSQLGMVYAQMGKTSAAVAATEKAIKLDPRSLTPYGNLFLINLQANRESDALKVLEQAGKNTNADAEYLVNLGGLYGAFAAHNNKLTNEAVTNGVAVLKRAAKTPDLDPQVSLKMAEAYGLLGSTADAAQVYQGLLAKYGAQPALRDELRSKLADLYLRAHDSKKAKEQLEAILRDNPANAQANYLLGNLAVDEKKPAEAIDYFERTVALNEQFEQAYYDLANTQINLDKPRDALGTLTRARALFPDSFLNQFYTGLAYTKAKDFTNALSRFSAAEKIAQTTETNRLNGYFYFEAGAAFEQAGNYEQACDFFEKSLKLAPNFAEALNYYGYMMADRGLKLDQARVMIEKAVKLQPTNAAFLDSLGWVLFKQGKAQQGLVQVRKAVDLSDQPDPTLLDHLGDIYTALKQPDKARDAWQKSLALEPNDAIRKKLDQAGGPPPK